MTSYHKQLSKQLAAHGITIAAFNDEYNSLFTEEVLIFLAHLHRNFEKQRKSFLEARREVELKIEATIFPQFLPETKRIRDDLTWQVLPHPTVIPPTSSTH